MPDGAAQGLGFHLFMGDGLDDLGPGDEHVAGLLHHDDEVGDGRGVDRPAGAGSHDDRDLGNDPGTLDIPSEDLPVAAQADHPFLNPGAAGIIEADDGRPVAQGQVHDLADLFTEGAAQTSAENRKVLGEDIDQPAVDAAVSGYHPVSENLLVFHTEIRTAMDYEFIEFLESPLIQKVFNPFPGRQFTLFMLGIDLVLTAGQFRQGHSTRSIL